MNHEQQPTWPVSGGVLELGDFAAEQGRVIAGTCLVWQAHGTLNGALACKARDLRGCMSPSGA